MIHLSERFQFEQKRISKKFKEQIQAYRHKYQNIPKKILKNADNGNKSSTISVKISSSTPQQSKQLKQKESNNITINSNNAQVNLENNNDTKNVSLDLNEFSNADNEKSMY